MLCFLLPLPIPLCLSNCNINNILLETGDDMKDIRILIADDDKEIRDLLKSWKYLSADDIPMFAIGFITSFIVAMLAVVTFLKLLEKIGLKPFAYYRILLAIVFTLFVLL